MERRRFNTIGAGVTILSVTVRWYMAYFCQFFLAFWIFDLPQPPLLVLMGVIGGGIVSLFSRYGGIITIIASLSFAASFTTGQLFQFSVASPSTASSFVCRPIATVYQVDEPVIAHIVGFWVAMAGGILTVVMGVSWTVPQGFKWRQSWLITKLRNR